MRSCIEEMTLLGCTEEQMAALYSEVPQMSGSVVFTRSLPSQVQTIGRGLPSDFCYAMSARLQVETSSHETKGLKSPATDQCDWLEHCISIVQCPPGKRSRQQQLRSIRE